MIDERILELYRSQLVAANEEKGLLYAQVKALTEEVSILRLSIEQSKHTANGFLSGSKSLCKKKISGLPIWKRSFPTFLSRTNLAERNVLYVVLTSQTSEQSLSRSTLNRYLHMGIHAIREKWEELFLR